MWEWESWCVTTIPMFTPHILFDKQLVLGESPLWDPESGALYVTNIEGGEIFSFNVKTGDERSYKLPGRVGMVALTTNRNFLLAALDQGFAKVDLTTGAIEPFGDSVEKGLATRLNDGKPGPDGRLYIGTMHLGCTDNIGAFYRLHRGGSIEKLFPGVTISNGIGWSTDETVLYHVDSALNQVRSFHFDSKRGQLGEPKLVANISQPGEAVFPHRLADGLCVDTRGDLWVAIYGQGLVVQYDARTGAILNQIRVPAPNVTNCVFGGADMDTLYITTARQHMTPLQLEQYPHAGGVFMVRLGLRGQVPYRYHL